jgi:putative CRISPR-associated protein (TIGR02619 family)
MASGDERRLIGLYANARQPEDVPTADAEILLALVIRVEEQLQESTPAEAMRRSAELNGLLRLYPDGLGTRSPQDYHLLLCTDTWLGSETARLIADWLRARDIRVEVKRQKDLQTASLEPFQLALAELVQWCEETLPGYRQSRYHVVFNLTGGFKSVQGFLQTLAMFYADETIYVFESGKELLRIPRLPVVMNEAQTVEQHLETFRRLALSLPITTVAGIPETFLMRVGEEVTLSPWGQIVWGRTASELYETRVFAPPSARLQFGPRFEKSVDRLAPNRRREVNRRIDMLCRVLESGTAYNLQSLDFKELQGNPLPPSTHECDAWSDEDARRLYGHYEKGVYVLDGLGSALH